MHIGIYEPDNHIFASYGPGYELYSMIPTAGGASLDLILAPPPTHFYNVIFASDSSGAMSSHSQSQHHDVI